jgi:raffinose/stachyose/melibiose transport system permease protein
MPNLIGGIVLGYIWQLIINGVLFRFDYSITSDARFGFWGLVILMNWQMIGYVMIIYIAGIQNIPEELLEAARVDGASPFRTLRSIIIPSVMPSITICLFLTITNSFKLFDQNLALTAGAPAKQTRMLALDIYSTFYGRIGYEGVGQAKAVIFFLIVATIALLQLYLTRRREVES